MVAALVDAMLPLILRAWMAENPDCDSGPSWANVFGDHTVSSALQAIHSNPAHPWTVAGLASKAGLSRAAFARRFSEAAGEPPLTYLTRWRIILQTCAGRFRLARRGVRETNAELVSLKRIEMGLDVPPPAEPVTDVAS